MISRQSQGASDQTPEGRADAQEGDAGGGDEEGDQGGVAITLFFQGGQSAVADGAEQG